jgi:hypothetical protein
VLASESVSLSEEAVALLSDEVSDAAAAPEPALPPVAMRLLALTAAERLALRSPLTFCCNHMHESEVLDPMHCIETGLEGCCRDTARCST